MERVRDLENASIEKTELWMAGRVAAMRGGAGRSCTHAAQGCGAAHVESCGAERKGGSRAGWERGRGDGDVHRWVRRAVGSGDRAIKCRAGVG